MKIFPLPKKMLSFLQFKHVSVQWPSGTAILAFFHDFYPLKMTTYYVAYVAYVAWMSVIEANYWGSSVITIILRTQCVSFTCIDMFKHVYIGTCMHLHTFCISMNIETYKKAHTQLQTFIYIHNETKKYMGNHS